MKGVVFISNLVFVSEQVLKHFDTFRLVFPSDPTVKEKAQLDMLQATGTHIPNTREVKFLLKGIPLTKKPTDNKSDIPIETVKVNWPLFEPKVDDEGELTLQNPTALMDVTQKLKGDGDQVKEGKRVQSVIEKIANISVGKRTTVRVTDNKDQT